MLPVKASSYSDYSLLIVSYSLCDQCYALHRVVYTDTQHVDLY